MLKKVKMGLHNQKWNMQTLKRKKKNYQTTFQYSTDDGISPSRLFMSASES